MARKNLWGGKVIMKYYRVNDVARLTGWSESKIRRWADKGEIAGVLKISLGKNEERLFTDESIESINKLKEEIK